MVTIQVSSELGDVIAADVKTGGYESVDAYLEEAIELLHERNASLSEDRADAIARIEQGLEQATRGEFVTPDEVRAMLRSMRNRS
jgi:Arc/MetJ-type ribon-helix-helix transcriptional regulator